MRPRAAEWLAEHDDAFVLVAWTYLFHGAHRDISVDLPGIERLLEQTEPTRGRFARARVLVAPLAALDASRR